LSTFADFNLADLYLVPALGVTQLKFRKIFGSRKLECLAIVWRYRFDRTPTCGKRTDGQTNKQTPGHNIYRASITSRGKDCV